MGRRFFTRGSVRPGRSGISRKGGKASPGLAFIQAGAGWRATYFHYAQKLRPAAEAPKLALTHTGPPADEAPTPDHVDDLRRRFGQLGHG